MLETAPMVASHDLHSVVLHASTALPLEQFAGGASKDSPSIICDEKPVTWCVKPLSLWQPT